MKKSKLKKGDVVCFQWFGILTIGVVLEWDKELLIQKREGWLIHSENRDIKHLTKVGKL